MSQIWQINEPHAEQQVTVPSVISLLEASQSGAPAAEMLTFLNQLVQVQYLSLVRYEPETMASDSQLAPQLLGGHTHSDPQRGARDTTTQQCFSIYRQRYYRQDQATAIAKQLHTDTHRNPRAITALHYSRADVPVPAWRDEIYVRARLSDRFSFFYTPAQGKPHAVNLYRDENCGQFSATDINKLLGVAPLLRQVHVGVLQSTSNEPGIATLQANEAIEHAVNKLHTLAPELSDREKQVCARIAHGMTADGISADLGIATSSVATLRKRAYAKLAQRHIFSSRYQLTRWLA
jgi:DNA-binding CsgD family transcriptional regulator